MTKKRKDPTDIFRVINIYLCINIILDNIDTGIETGHFIQRDKQDFNRFKARFKEYVDIFWKAYSKDSDKLQAVEFGHAFNSFEKFGKLVGNLEPAFLYILADFIERLHTDEFDKNGMVYDFSNVYSTFKFQEVLTALQDNLKKISPEDLGSLLLWYDGQNHVVCDIHQGNFGLVDSTGEYRSVPLTDIEAVDLLAFNNAVWTKILEGKTINFESVLDLKLSDAFTLRLSKPYVNHLGMEMITFHYQNNVYKARTGDDWGTAILIPMDNGKVGFDYRGQRIVINRSKLGSAEL